ncbi:hypothetical protein PIB30_078625 [Stylosanthes scabra]|uniref:Uncharacterized protein n=1 Tax=Stylosanthes scabra TaxID=79078 RepID=A0ABU6TQF5_9FABA|nr:hypothetical protein [Stylosanthes scabra]
MVELLLSSSNLIHCSSYPPIPRKVSRTGGRGAYLKCSLELRNSSNVVLTKQVLLSGLAASFILLSPPSQVSSYQIAFRF